MKYFLYLCFIASFALLITGCNDANDTQKLKEQINTLEKELEAIKNQEPNYEEPSGIEESTPKEIKLKDPDTNKIIYSFFPENLGYEDNSEQYLSEIKQIAKELAQGKDGNEGYDQKMVPDKFSNNGQIIKGSPRVILKETELVNNILDLSATGGEILLPLYTYESNYDLEEIDSLQQEVIGSYTTYFDSNVAGRSHNIKQSANAITNIIIGVDDYFSFNTTVGPRTEETGYQPALEIVNGNYVMGIGGGICQTSSTLFNAVDQVGVHYIEKHHHSLSVGYVPKGRDATVSYGTLDFRFQNVLGFPFIIKASTTSNSITVEILTSKVNAQALKNN